MSIPRVVVAGTHSGSGKTSVVLGLLRAFAARGLTVQPFKAGPDFIDPGLHAAACGRPSRNLDTWLLPAATVQELFDRSARGAHLAIIEGMMGLYDGVHGAGDDGSTAEVAKLLAAPVILAVDVSGAARSAAAQALGFAAFDPQVEIAGVIATRAGGPRHVRWLREALDGVGIPLLGTLPWREDLRLPERHLGLVPAAEAAPEAAIDALAGQAAEHIDLEAILRIARHAPAQVIAGPPVFPIMPAPPAVAIGVARDRAFSFYYQDALDLLEAHGAQLVPFSPIDDADLPAVDGLYLGGGFPEVHAAALSANRRLRSRIAEAVADGMPVYAECGGMMYLCRALADAEGREHEMVGVIPAVARVASSLAALGYVTLRAEADTLLLRRGERIRAHEFHFSTVELAGRVSLAYASEEGRGIAGGRDGIARGALLASYAHLHLASHPVMAQRLVNACRRFRNGRRGART